MEAMAQGRSSLPEVLMQVIRLWVLLVQNRMHLYRLLLLKIALFQGWVRGLSLEARGPCPCPVPTHQCPGAGMGCARALLLALRCLGICKWPGLCVTSWTGLLRSCLHSLMLVALLSLLLAWRLFQKAQCFLGWLPCQALLGSRTVLELLALLRCLFWHLAYLVTWTTCLASHLLQAAFEHTAQLARVQEASGPLSGSPLPASSSTLESWPLLQEPGSPRQ
ncbi:transmembrane protein 270 [Fukomys damarensis]|uniref:transmembrane protein 270 n=1 Tax=Fukomys damarensis TaxID=885580 RepID=UPI0008FEC469|nr:transmembrane protein 270 [Fukomys damarensis]